MMMYRKYLQMSNFQMSKRAKFIISSVLLAMGFLGVGLLENEARFIGIGGLGITTLILVAWSLWEGLGRNASLLTLLLPGLFTVGVGLFWFLLPATMIARLPVVVMYAIGIYGLLSTMNIFAVSASAVRTIALVRAAKGVGFVLTLFTSFLLFDAILSLKISVVVNFVSAVALSFPLFLQGLWTSDLSHNLKRQLLIYSAVFSYNIGCLSVLLYFWPVTVVVGSLFLTVGMYILLGLGQAQVEGRLFKQTIREYLLVGILVFLAMFFVTSWRG